MNTIHYQVGEKTIDSQQELDSFKSSLDWIISIASIGIIENFGAHASEITYVKLDESAHRDNIRYEYSDIFENDDWFFLDDS